MIGRTTAEAALEAHQRTARAGRGYGGRVNQIVEGLTRLNRSDFLRLGLELLRVAGADERQLSAAWALSGLHPTIRRSTPPRRVVSAVARAQELLLPIGIVRLALACLDQGGLPVTAARLVEVLCWEEPS